MKVSDKRYYADKNGKLVEESSESAAFLVVAEGGEVTEEMTEKYGIKGVEREEAKAEAGIVTSAAGDSNEQGFVAAADVQKAGGVVTDAPNAKTDEEAKPAPKASKKVASRKGK